MGNFNELAQALEAIRLFKLDLNNQGFGVGACAVQKAQSIVTKCGETFYNAANEVVDVAMLKLPANTPEDVKEAIRQDKKVEYFFKFLELTAVPEAIIEMATKKGKEES